MKQLIFLLICWLFPASVALASEPCLQCHADSLATRQLAESAHADKLGCADCHGQDHDRIEKGAARVSAQKCGTCHAEQLKAHQASRHGMGLHAGWGCTRNQPDRDRQECAFCHREGDTRPVSTVQCARFLKQSSEMGQIGCNRCHGIEDSCADCHGNHLTDPRVAGNPGVCAKCHMGPDHPQYEVWQTSQHGSLYEILGAQQAPDCQRCHMPQGEHDVSLGLTAPPSGKAYAPDVFRLQRELMLQRCQGCHASGFAARDLSRADAVRDQTLSLVSTARQLVLDLDDRGLLLPSPADRPPHPHRGQQLVLDGDMLYEDLSLVESLYFRLYKFAAAKTFKGAYHQNPAYTHWYGNAELKLLLSQIKAEALRLKGADKDQSPAVQADTSENELKVLQRKYQRGELDEDTYARQKRKIIDQLTLQ